MSKVLVRNPFTLDLAEHSDASAISEFAPSLTVQADAQSADINFIVKQFGLTHELPYGRQVPEFADYSNIPNDFHAAQQFIIDSQDTFMTMEASVRAEFDNDAGKFLDFVHNPANYDRAISLGLVPAKAPVVPPVDGAVSAPSPVVDKP